MTPDIQHVPCDDCDPSPDYGPDYTDFSQVMEWALSFPVVSREIPGTIGTVYRMAAEMVAHLGDHGDALVLVTCFEDDRHGTVVVTGPEPLVQLLA